jgi:hypothetical protein
MGWRMHAGTLGKRRLRPVGCTKPEEVVRQLYVKMLMEDYGYPPEPIFIGKPVQFGPAFHEKAAGIVAADKDLVECKKNEVCRRP